MKSKNLIIISAYLILYTILFSSTIYAIEGEFRMKYAHSESYVNVSVSIKTVSTGWDWTGIDWRSGNVVLADSFTHAHTMSENMKEIGYDAPKSDDQSNVYVIPWALVEFKIKPGNFPEKTFYIDFRDEGWSQNFYRYYIHPDIYLIIDQYDGSMKLDVNNGAVITPIQNLQVINIWDAYGTLGSPETSNFTIPVMLTNRIAGENAGGTLKINSTMYSSGVSATLPFNPNISTYNVSTNNERFTNYNQSGITYKHHDWNANALHYQLQQSVLFDADNTQQDAIFEYLAPATLQIYNLDGATNLDIEFQDPWHKEQDGTQPGNWKTYTGSFTPPGAYGESVGGIFKNHNPTFDPSVHIYSTRAISSQAKNGITYYFTGWSTNGNAQLSQVGGNPPGYDQKAVVFTNDNAVVTANYKAHLASGSVNALANNNQHKIVRDVIGVYHAVYESAGKIFYTSSADGASWSNEVYLSGEIDALGHASRNPAIDLYYDESAQTWKPVVVWESHNNSNNNQFALAGRRISGTQWAPTEFITGDYVNSSSDATPALAFPYVIFKGSNGLYIMRSLGPGQYGAWVWDNDPTLISGTSSSSKSPSALYNRWTDSKTHLVWENGGSIYYRNMSYNAGYQWSGVETVATGIDEIVNANPALTMDNSGYVWIAWEFINTEIINVNRIRVRKRLGTNSYGAISSFGSGSGNPFFYTPSISGNRQKSGNNNLSVAWHKSTNEVQKVSYVSGAWGNISTLSSSHQTPQLVFNESPVTFTDKIGFSRSTSGSVYALTPISFSEGGGMQKSSDYIATQQYTRGVITSLDQTEYTIQFGNIQLKQAGAEPRMIALAALPDTISVNTAEEIASYLRSEPFIAAERSELSIELHEYPLSGINANLSESDVIYKLEFVENATGKVLYTMHSSRLSEQKTTIDILPYSFGVTGNKEVYIRLTIVPQGDMHPLFTVVNEYSDEAGGSLNKSGIRENATIVDFIPKEYLLGQNYPNPFNPATVISYTIPQSGMVTLKIFDALGREVKTLVNEHKAPERYSVEFDASELSSGFYFCRMVSADFSKTIKLILTK